jgi:acetyl-CoA C-acetyltransferase
MKPETRISADGLCAAIHAACQIRAGAYDTVLVVAHAKPSMSDYYALTEWALDPIFLQPLGMDFLACAGLQASAIAARDDGALKRWATIAARRLTDATGGGQILTNDDVLHSEIITAPLREKMCAPLADGACACILRRADSPQSGRQQIHLTGLGHDLAANFIGDRDLAELSGLARAATRAYTDAGIGNPADEIDIAEPSVAFAHEEDLFIQAAGLNGNTIISPDGGLFAGYVPIVAGLSRLAMAAGHLQSGDARQTVAHGSWGPAGQGQAVVVLENAA